MMKNMLRVVISGVLLLGLLGVPELQKIFSQGFAEGRGEIRAATLQTAAQQVPVESKDLDESRRSYDQQQAEVQALKDRQSALEKQVRELGNEATQAKAELALALGAKRQAEQEANQRSGGLLKALEAKAAEREVEAVKFREDNSRIQKRLADHETRIRQLEERIEAAERGRQEAEEAAQRSQREAEEAAQALEAEKTRQKEQAQPTAASTQPAESTQYQQCASGSRPASTRRGLFRIFCR